MTFALRTSTFQTGNLPNAERILVGRGTEALNSVGKLLQADARTKVRRFTGQEARGVKVKVSGKGLNKFVEVYGELVQHYVDENGLPPGIFPPWDVGSRIYNYVERKGLINQPPPLKARLLRRASHVNTRRPAHLRASGRGAQAGRGKNRTSAGVESGKAANRKARVRNVRATRTKSAGQLGRERAIRRIAFVVARSIFERGITANRWASRTLEDNRTAIIRDLQTAFTEAVGEINGG